MTGGGRIEPQAMWGRRRAEYAGDNRDRGRRDNCDRLTFAAGGDLGSTPKGVRISPRMPTGRVPNRDCGPYFFLIRWGYRSSSEDRLLLGFRSR